MPLDIGCRFAPKDDAEKDEFQRALAVVAEHGAMALITLEGSDWVFSTSGRSFVVEPYPLFSSDLTAYAVSADLAASGGLRPALVAVVHRHTRVKHYILNARVIVGEAEAALGLALTTIVACAAKLTSQERETLQAIARRVQ